MKGRNSITGKVHMERVHITLPRDLHLKVRESAKNTDRSYSQMITSILRGVYGGGK